MVSAADFDIFVKVMFWSAVAIFDVSMALMVLLLLVRIRAIARRRHTQKLVALWRAIFTGVLPNLPRRIVRRDAFTVLNLWTDFHRVQSNGRGVSSEVLSKVAAVQGFDRMAARLLTRGDAGDRLVALTFLGYYPLPAIVDDIRRCAFSALGELSLAAHRALVAIDPIMMRGFADAIAERDDFQPRTVGQILKAIGPQTASIPMVEAAKSHERAGRVRILRYFTLLDAAVARSALREILENDDNPEVLAAALRSLTPFSSIDDRPVVRRFLNHPAAFVRIAAIRALVPICDAQDRSTLMTLLGDHDAWVRYRAAQTLLDCFAHEGTEGDLRRDVADRYARDALTQVLMERSVVELRQSVADENGTAQAVADERCAPVEWRRMDAMRTEN